MEDELIELLESLGYGVYRQGSLVEDDYPATFFTYWNNQDEEHSAYDNQTAMVAYDYDVNVYSNDPSITYNLLAEARTLLKSKGWIIADRGHDVASDVNTHIGRGMTIIFLR